MRIGIWVIAVILCGSIFGRLEASAQVNNGPKEAPKANYQAPAFELPSLAGDTYHVGGRRDKLLLLNFWASWCEPCHMEAGDLQSIYNDYKGRLDLYAVNVTYMDRQADVVDFVYEYELTFPTLLDMKGDVSRMKYWIDGYPTSFLVNKSGVIVEVYYGTIDKATLEQDIQRWL